VLGDYQQAEQLLAKSADAGQHEETAYLVAAHAAQAQSMDSNANHYLAKLDQDTASQRNTNLESILVKLDILMTQNKLAEARALMDQNHTKIGHDSRLLAKEIELSLLELRFDNAISFIAKARKAKDGNTTKVQRWIQLAFEGKFNELLKQQSNDALHNYWQSLSRKDKQNDDIIIAYCRVLAKANINEPLEKLLIPVIKKGVNQNLINQIKLLPLHKPTALLSAVQKHLQSSPQNSLWLSCLGHLAASNQDWPLAERAFNSLLNSGDDTSQNDDVDIATFGHVLTAQGKFEQATKVLLAK
jgi:HemY protein